MTRAQQLDYYLAAVEYEKARDLRRVAARAGRVTDADRRRTWTAETRWDQQRKDSHAYPR